MAALMILLIATVVTGKASAQFPAPPGFVKLGNPATAPGASNTAGLVRLGPPGAAVPAPATAPAGLVRLGPPGAAVPAPAVQFVPPPVTFPTTSFTPTTTFVEPSTTTFVEPPTIVPEVIVEEPVTPEPQPTPASPPPPSSPAPPTPAPAPAPAPTPAPAEGESGTSNSGETTVGEGDDKQGDQGSNQQTNEGENEAAKPSTSPEESPQDSDSIDVTLDPVASDSECSDVIAVASEIPNLGTLVKAVKAAGVLDKLSGSDKVFTILAPSDEAFGATLKVIGVTEEEFLSSPALLKRVLALHIIPGQALRSSDLSDGQSYDSLSGKPVKFSVLDQINEISVSVPSGVEADVILKDLEACSSIIHVIGTVLLPEPSQEMKVDGDQESSDSKEDSEKGSEKDSEEETPTSSEGEKEAEKVEALAPVENGGGACSGAFDPLKSRNDFGTFLELTERIGFLGQIGSTGTVLAPTDLAFEKLLEDLQLKKEDLLSEKSKGLVESILRFHIVSGKVLKAGDLKAGENVSTLLGSDKVFQVQKAGEVLATKGSTGTLTTTNLDSCIGVIHVIDTVLIPDP